MITRKAMDAKLAEPDHADRYRKRQQAVEPVFGNIKANLGYRRFSLRSLPAVNSEWRLICASHNSGGQTPPEQSFSNNAGPCPPHKAASCDSLCSAAATTITHHHLPPRLE